MKTKYFTGIISLLLLAGSSFFKYFIKIVSFQIALLWGKIIGKEVRL